MRSEKKCVARSQSRTPASFDFSPTSKACKDRGLPDHQHTTIIRRGMTFSCTRTHDLRRENSCIYRRQCMIHINHLTASTMITRKFKKEHIESTELDISSWKHFKERHRLKIEKQNNREDHHLANSQVMEPCIPCCG